MDEPSPPAPATVPPVVAAAAPPLRGAITLLRLPVGHDRERIPLRAHWTMLLALPYFGSVFLRQLSLRATPSTAEGLALALLLALGLFASVAIHELCHTALGVRLGARVRAITLMFLGGMSEMSRPPRTLLGEVAMAAAGPASSLALAAVAWGVAHALAGTPRTCVILVAQMNLAIGVFNLVPAFPLDGGRVLRGLLALRLGPARATRAAVFAGRLLAVALGALGVLGGNPLLVFIALFIYFGAASEAGSASPESRLEHVAVAQLMTRASPPLAADLSVEDAAARFAAATTPDASDTSVPSDHSALLVERGGRVVGVVRHQRVQAVPFPYRREIPVAAIMADPPSPLSPDDPLAVALRRMRDESVDELPVAAEGRLAGTVRLADVERYLREQQGT